MAVPPSRERRTPLAVPEQVYVLAKLLRTGSGKIDRDRLYWQAEAGGVAVLPTAALISHR